MTVRDYLASMAKEYLNDMVYNCILASKTNNFIDRTGFVNDAGESERFAGIYISLLKKLPITVLDAHMEGTEMEGTENVE